MVIFNKVCSKYTLFITLNNYVNNSIIIKYLTLENCNTTIQNKINYIK
jgi:hypothetical protein